MLIVGIAEFYATIPNRATMQHKTMHAGFHVCLTMGLGRRREKANLRISLRINAKTLPVLCLEVMLVSTAIWYCELQNKVDRQATFDLLNWRASRRCHGITQAMSLFLASHRLASRLFTSS